MNAGLFKFIPYIWSLLMAVILTILLSPLRTSLGLVNIAMIYLLPVLYSASKWGKAPAFVAASAGLLAFDFFFVPPVGSFTVHDARYLITFGIFLLVGMITGSLSEKLKEEATNSRQRATRVAALYALSRDIAAVADLESVLGSVSRNVADTVEGDVVVLLPDEGGKLELSASSSQAIILEENEMDLACRTYERGKTTHNGSDVLETVDWLFLPLQTELGIQGVLGFRSNHGQQGFNNEQIQLLEAFAGLTAMAINRVKLSEQARRAQTLIESERLRTALFNSLSHDLRTPLASIIGAVTGLLEGDNIFTPASRRDLLLTIQQGAARMHRFVNNLLDMARLESGMLKLKKEWCDIQDIIGVVINRLDDSARSRTIKTELEHDLPLVKGDFALLEQVLINLLDNALKYSEAETEIIISAGKADKMIKISVADSGSSIPEEDLPKIFDKFYRLRSRLQVSGTGLGLSICKGIIEAHGGEIWAENNADSWVKISFTLPLSEDLPGEIPEFEEGETIGNKRLPDTDC